MIHDLVHFYRKSFYTTDTFYFTCIKSKNSAVMLCNFFVTVLVICATVSVSTGVYNDGSKDKKCGIPPKCSDSYETFATPTNHICSISYLLFTKDNINSPCYVEPENKYLDSCEFDPNKQTQFVIHGYSVRLKPGNLFEQIKDEILTVENSNVIIVNWTKYDNFKYNRSVEYAYTVGVEVGNFINFLVDEKGVNPGNVHIIGHSLGAHVAGVAGKQVPGLGRITGLDPAAVSYSLSVTYNRLTATDADFVDIVHCSSGVTANNSIRQGIPNPIGDIDFYPNGGTYQPSCILGRNYISSDGETKTMKTSDDLQTCRHQICPTYFLNSIRDCKYLSRKCNSYKSYENGKCFSKSHPEDQMGFYAVKIPSLPTYSKFYLTTTPNPPYCS